MALLVARLVAAGSAGAAPAPYITVAAASLPLVPLSSLGSQFRAPNRWKARVPDIRKIRSETFSASLDA